MDHLTNEQMLKKCKEEFSKLSGGQATIDRKQTILLITKMGYDERDNELSNLLCDADVECDDKIDVEGVITIINYLAKKDKNRPQTFVDFDETQVANATQQLHNKIMSLMQQGVNIDNQLYIQLCKECGVPSEENL